MFPPAIIFINGNIDGYGSSLGDLDQIGKLTLESQLFIDETITGQEFDLRVQNDPNYPFLIHSFNYRILVIRSDFSENTSREYADVILFVKNGLASVIKNNYGEPGLTIQISNINIYDLLRYNKSSYVAIIPESYTTTSSSIGGIFAIQKSDTSGVYESNPDNEINNYDFIHRK